jgi:hypothetical protein
MGDASRMERYLRLLTHTAICAASCSSCAHGRLLHSVYCGPTTVGTRNSTWTASLRPLLLTGAGGLPAPISLF